MRKKKNASIFLTLLLALIMFSGLSGCQKETGPLRILVDIVGNAEQREKDANTVKDYLRLHGYTGEIEIETLPTEGADRTMALTRIRTEVMAGGGPDIFIVGNHTEYSEREGRNLCTSLFLMPEKSMELGLFLPLDEYLEKAQYIEPDKMTPVVMEAGYSEKWGQTILPMTYSFSATFFDKGDMPQLPQVNTWDEMLADDTLVFQAAAAKPQKRDWSHFPASFGVLADYKNKQLAFTEEELLQRINEFFVVEDRHKAGAFSGLLPYYQSEMGIYFWMDNTILEDNARNGNDALTDYFPGVQEDIDGVVRKDFTIAPVYSDDGGITATIDAFAAINANTKRPDNAFAALDILFGTEAYQTLNIFGFSSNSLVTRDDLYTADLPVRCHHLTDENWAELDRVRSEITHANFAGTIFTELNVMFGHCIGINEGYLEGTIEEEIATTYSRMRKELSE